MKLYEWIWTGLCRKTTRYRQQLQHRKKAKKQKNKNFPQVYQLGIDIKKPDLPSTPPLHAALSAFHQTPPLIFDRQHVEAFLLAEENDQETRQFNHRETRHDGISAPLLTGFKLVILFWTDLAQ